MQIRAFSVLIIRSNVSSHRGRPFQWRPSNRWMPPLHFSESSVMCHKCHQAMMNNRITADLAWPQPSYRIRNLKNLKYIFVKHEILSFRYEFIGLNKTFILLIGKETIPTTKYFSDIFSINKITVCQCLDKNNKAKVSFSCRRLVLIFSIYSSISLLRFCLSIRWCGLCLESYISISCLYFRPYLENLQMIQTLFLLSTYTSVKSISNLQQIWM